MTTLNKKKILDELKDKETRELFVEEHVTTGIPFQIHSLREKLGLTQTELARKAGMAPERISVLEDPNYEFIPKIPTLLKLAAVFDVPLIVRFGSWSELFSWETELSPEALAPETFNEELPYLERAASGLSFTTAAVHSVPYVFRVGGVPSPPNLIFGHTLRAQFRWGGFPSAGFPTEGFLVEGFQVEGSEAEDLLGEELEIPLPDQMPVIDYCNRTTA